jgi:hypothetical protein
LTKLLAETDAIVGELVAAIPRASLTASYGERVSASGSLHAPLPINDGALDAHIALDKWLMKTALELAKVTGARLVGRDSSGLASYLLSHMGTLRRQDWAGGVVRELGALIAECERQTRTATHKEFAGTCQTPECGADMFVRAGEDNARCKTCGAEYAAVQQWRTTAKRYARDTEADVLGYPSTLAQRLARVHGETITPEHIRLLASRGVLIRANPEVGADGKKLRPMYKLGDVKALVKPKVEDAA